MATSAGTARSSTTTASCIRGVLLDLSGTLHIGLTAISRAVEAIEKLMVAASNHDLKVCVLTNTSTTSSASLMKQLQTMGFRHIGSNFGSNDDPTDGSRIKIVTSVLATCSHLRANPHLRPLLLVEDLADFESIPLDPPHNCVVVGLAPSKMDYHHLNQAYQILQEHPEDGRLIAIHRANYIKTVASSESSSSKNLFSLGPGAFISALESASGCTACVMGKPSRAFYESAMTTNDFQSIPSAEVCMVGDDILGDIAGARDAGIGTTILVQTGKYQEGDEGKIAPTLVVPSIVEAVDYILQHVCGAYSSTSAAPAALARA
jgi:HAD superfamily hydrolase (TIGR01458 family)